MVFGEIIGSIGFTFAPKNLELTLADAISDPVESHVDGFGALLFDGVSRDTTCSTVIGCHGSGGLWMAHFFERESKRARFFAVVE